jgi:AcrR family transcriptional regulator
MQRRAKSQEETRRRIVHAAVELHTTVGPAHTTDHAIAKRAGVTRRTFYRHFPDEVSLFRACTTHGLEMWPPPDPESWRRVADPKQRLRIALGELYAYYAEAGSGLMAIWRDSYLLRPELNVSPSRGDVFRAMPAVLSVGWRVRGRKREVVAAALSHATSVTTWHSLVDQQGMRDEEAVELLIGMVLLAVVGSPPALAPLAYQLRDDKEPTPDHRRITPSGKRTDT